MIDISELKRRLPTLALEELARMVTTDRSQYADDAIAMVEAELVARGVSGLTIDGVPQPLKSDEVQYGGFLRRFAAYWLDVIAFAPVVTLGLLLSAQWRLYYVWALAPGALVGLWFHVDLVKRFGGTPGKLLMNLRIRKVDGTRIEYREATLRYLVLFMLSLLQSLAVAISALNMSNEEYLALGFIARSQRLLGQAPSWNGIVTVCLQIWVWGEFVVMLTNKKRRALHDFMAGTVVVRRNAA